MTDTQNSAPLPPTGSYTWALVLGIAAAPSGVQRQPWACVLLAEEMFKASKPSSQLHKALTPAFNPRRGFSATKLFDALLDLTRSGVLIADGTGAEAVFRISDCHSIPIADVWNGVLASDKEAVRVALQCLDASSVAMSNMRRRSGDSADGNDSGDPAFRHVKRARVRVTNS